MEMVAASKMRKAQERMRAARPYAEKIRQVAAHLSRANPEYKHPFLVKRDAIKNVGVIVVTSDKGLCGGLNTNILRLVVGRMKEWESTGPRHQGMRDRQQGFRLHVPYRRQCEVALIGLGDTPHIEKLIGAVKVMLDSYVAGEIDAVYLSYNGFVNTMKQEPTIEQVLPLTGDEPGNGEWRDLGLHLRTGCQSGGGRIAGALYRVAGV